jgi:hypothetical protein
MGTGAVVEARGPEHHKAMQPPSEDAGRQDRKRCRQHTRARNTRVASVRNGLFCCANIQGPQPALGTTAPRQEPQQGDAPADPVVQ